MKRLAIVALCIGLVGCGFHLRTAQEFTLPPSLAVVRVAMPTSSLKYPEFALIVRRALLERGVEVVDKGNVPAIVLSGETLTPLIVSVNNNGGASAYLLNYATTFSVQGPGGRVLLAPTVVRVQREYTFDALNILAMAREQAYLQKRMRIAAARQIIWRLASFKSPPPKSPPPKSPPHAP